MVLLLAQGVHELVVLLHQVADLLLVDGLRLADAELQGVDRRLEGRVLREKGAECRFVDARLLLVASVAARIDELLLLGDLGRQLVDLARLRVDLFLGERKLALQLLDALLRAVERGALGGVDRVGLAGGGGGHRRR